MLTAYEGDFAAEWGRKVRAIIEEYGSALFGVQVDPRSNAANRWDIAGHDGGMVSAGVGGPIMGKRAHLLLVDDPVKNAEEALSEAYRDRVWDWFRSTAFPRLHPDGQIAVIMTRWHKDDLAGRLIAESGDRWHVVNLPAVAEEDELDEQGTTFRSPGDALWPDRFPIATLAEVKRTVGPFWWQSLYQGHPTQHERAEWPEEYFGDNVWFDHYPAREVWRVLALDPSKGKSDKRGDYSAIVWVTVGADDCLYVDASIERRPVERMVVDACDVFEQVRPQVFGVESNGFQELVGGNLDHEIARRGLFAVPVHSIVNTSKKEIRIRRLGGFLAQGRVRFKNNSPGCALLVQQLRDFPLGTHDDGPDALEMCVQLLEGLVGMPSDGIGERLVSVP